MIQLRRKHTAPIPTVLSNAGIAEKNAICQSFVEGKRQFAFDANIYGHIEVKSALRAIQYDKCCFCEAKIGHISYGDIEHYRPKKGWIQENEALNSPGYYWLAYDWDNLLLSCQICNQRHKKNFFPLLDNSRRALNHESDIATEVPFFVKPDAENPADFIEFKEEIPFPIDNGQRGTLTIQTLGLDREPLNENRRTKLTPIRILYNLAKDIPGTSPGIRKRALDEIKKIATEYTADHAEYAAMFRAFFKENPVDFE